MALPRPFGKGPYGAGLYSIYRAQDGGWVIYDPARAGVWAQPPGCMTGMWAQPPDCLSGTWAPPPGVSNLASK